MGDAQPAIEWRRVYKEALAVLLERMPPRRAEELVAAGVEAVYLGQAPWDATGKLTLVQHVIAVGFNMMRNERRKEATHRRADLAAKAAEVVAANPPTPEEALEEKEHKTRLYELLVAACVGDGQALAIIDAERLGIRGLDAQVEHFGWSERVVRNVRERIGERMKKILDDEDRQEAAS